jgi:hypothetical protein
MVAVIRASFSIRAAMLARVYRKITGSQATIANRIDDLK